MTHQDIIANLCLKYPPEVIHEITTEIVITELVRRMGEETLDLSAEDLELAKEEVKAAIEHHLTKESTSTSAWTAGNWSGICNLNQKVIQ